jgi:hypothetical protein
MSLFTFSPGRGRAFVPTELHWAQKSSLLFSFFCALLPALTGCGNPAIDVIVNDLGPEDSAVPVGPFHRPGQPCVACHGPYYGASPRMSIAGTIFASLTKAADATKPVPVNKAQIVLVDTDNKPDPMVRAYPRTNCAGNFYISYDDFVPQFPVAVQVQCPDPKDMADPANLTPLPTIALTMQGRISREGSCNACHRGERNQGSPGWAVCSATPIFGYPSRDTVSAECKGEIKRWWDANAGL